MRKLATSVFKTNEVAPECICTFGKSSFLPLSYILWRAFL